MLSMAARRKWLDQCRHGRRFIKWIDVSKEVLDDSPLRSEFAQPEA